MPKIWPRGERGTGWHRARSALTAFGFFAASLAPCSAEPAPFIRLEGKKLSDVAFIDLAGQQIDMAAYELRDWLIIQALIRAADRGVKVRIYLDGVPSERDPAKSFDDLVQKSGVEVRTKHDPTTLMHLNSYEIDGRLLRTDDMAVIENTGAVAAFAREFDERFAAGDTLPSSRKQ
jgi:phosphatidylserine/phosphatidylglycerophosphate/cardiolipin synthase-like enzyme